MQNITDIDTNAKIRYSNICLFKKCQEFQDFLILFLQIILFILTIFSNFSINLNDPSILSSLNLNIRTKNMNFVQQAQTIVIIYFKIILFILTIFSNF